jgi:putative cardiolipin synthase
VFTAGPVVQQLSGTFDQFWNSKLAIPAGALGGHHSAAPPARARQLMQPLSSPGIDYVAMLKTQEPYAGMISGRLPLEWAAAQVVCDSPDKKDVENGARRGRLMARPVVRAASEVKGELLMITPYFVPAKDELQTLYTLLQSRARVAILTNSLESAPTLLAQSGYVHYRIPLLKAGANLYEVRSQLGNVRGSGQTARISHFGNYALHAKLFVFDRRRLFIGSMNYDQRSKSLNTEVGLIIDSPVLAAQITGRFEHMTQPENAYVLTLQDGAAGTAAKIAWDTLENGKPVKYAREPGSSAWQRFKLAFLALLPVGGEL